MAIALFLKVDGADGESANAKHKNWIDVESFHWGADSAVVDARRRGRRGWEGEFSRPHDHLRTWTSRIRRCSVNCSSGKHISKVQIAGAKAGGEEVEYFKITMEDVLVTSVDVSGANGAQVTVNYSFQAAKVKSEYSVQDKAGTKGATSEFGWDIKENKKL